MPVTRFHHELVSAVLAIGVVAFALAAQSRSYSSLDVTKAMVDAWWHLTYACQGSDAAGPDHDGGDASACQLREHLARYIEERGWCLGEGWAPCR